MNATAPPRFAAALALACAALMCAAPGLLGIHVLPLSSFYEEWLAAALGVAACVATLAATWRRPATVPSIALPLLAFLGVLAVQLVAVDIAYPQQVLLAMLYVLLAIALAWCGLQLRDALGAERVCRAIAWSLLAGGALNALAAIVQAYAPASVLASVVSPLVGPRPFGNLSQANLLADQLGLAAASLLYLCGSGRLHTAPAVALGALLAVGLSLSGSRSVWLYAAWLLAWSLAGRQRTRSPVYRSLALAVIAGGIVLTVLALTLPPLAAPGAASAAPAAGLERLAAFSIETGRTGAEGVRLYFWRQAWAMFADAPLLGVGFGQFAWHFLAQSVQFAELAIPGQERNAHNLVLQLAAETGLAGVLCVLVALGLWLWRAIRAPLDLERWWIVAAAGVTLLHSLVEYPLWHAHFLGPFALLVGLGETTVVAPRQNQLARFALVASFAFGAVMLGSLITDFSELRRWIYLVPEQAVGHPAVASRQQEVVRRLQPTLLGPYVDLPLTATVRVDAENLDAKLAFNGRVMRFSAGPPVVLRQVVYLALARRNAEARWLLDRAAVAYPGELDPFAADLERLAARGLDVSAIAAHLAAKRGKN